MVKLFTSARKALADTQDAALARFLQVRAVAKDFLTRKEEGATMVEYGIMIALVAAVCIAIIKVIGTKVSNAFESVNTPLW
jgi:pilus assembly protein Flp/PilA